MCVYVWVFNCVPSKRHCIISDPSKIVLQNIAHPGAHDRPRRRRHEGCGHSPVGGGQETNEGNAVKHETENQHTMNQTIKKKLICNFKI